MVDLCYTGITRILILVENFKIWIIEKGIFSLPEAVVPNFCTWEWRSS